MYVFCLRWLIVYSPTQFLVLGNCLSVAVSSIAFINFIICFRLLVPYVKSDALFKEPTSELCEIETSNSGYIAYVIVIWYLLLPPVHGSKLRSKNLCTMTIYTTGKKNKVEQNYYENFCPLCPMVYSF